MHVGATHQDLSVGTQLYQDALRCCTCSCASRVACCLPQEYRRAAHTLKGLGGPKTLFLRSYATYLAGEKRRDEERLEAAGPLGKSDAVNRVSALPLETKTFLQYECSTVLTRQAAAAQDMAKRRPTVCAVPYKLDHCCWAVVTVVCSRAV